MGKYTHLKKSKFPTLIKEKLPIH